MRWNKSRKTYSNAEVCTFVTSISMRNVLFPMRYLCDWRLFVEPEDCNIGQQRVQNIYKQFNINRFVSVFGAIDIDHFGMDVRFVLNIGRDAELDERILYDIL